MIIIKLCTIHRSALKEISDRVARGEAADMLLVQEEFMTDMKVIYLKW